MRWFQAVVPHADTTALLEAVCQEEHIRLQVQLEVVLVCGVVEGLPYFRGSGILCLAARLVVEVREEGVSGWQGRLFHLVPCVEVLVGEDTLAEEHVEVRVRCSIDLEGGPKMLEEVLRQSEEIGRQCLERAFKELQADLEHQVLAPAQRQVFLHSLADDVDVEPWERAKPPHDQVRILAAEVVEKEWHLVPLPQNQIAPLVCCTAVLARQIVVVAHLVLVEGAMANVALEGLREIPLVVQPHH